MKNAESNRGTSPIMRLARRLPGLLSRSDRLEGLASNQPEGSASRETLKHRSAEDFQRACEIESKIVDMVPRDLDDAVVLLALAAEFAETAEYACGGGEIENARSDLNHLRSAVKRALILAVDLTDFDLTLIGIGA